LVRSKAKIALPPEGQKARRPEGQEREAIINSPELTTEQKLENLLY